MRPSPAVSSALRPAGWVRSAAVRAPRPRESQRRWLGCGAPECGAPAQVFVGLCFSSEGELGWRRPGPLVPGWSAGGQRRADRRWLLLHLPRRSFLWKVACIFFPCLGFTGKGQDESLRCAQSRTWELGKGPTAGTPRGKVTELLRILALEPGSGQGVEAGMRARTLPCPLLRGGEKPGPRVLLACLPCSGRGGEDSEISDQV